MEDDRWRIRRAKTQYSPTPRWAPWAGWGMFVTASGLLNLTHGWHGIMDIINGPVEIIVGIGLMAVAFIKSRTLTP